MTGGVPEIDPHGSDVARFYPHARTRTHVHARTAEGYNKTYGIVHPMEQWASNRDVRLSPFNGRERDLGAVFYETAGWERPFWYGSNEALLDEYGDRVMPRKAEWEARWWSPIINAEHLAMRDRVAMVDLSAFAILDIAGPAALDVVQRMAVKQMDVPVGRVVYTPLLNPAGGVKADLTIMRLSGDPVPLLLPPDAPRSEIFRVRAELGLDRPLPVQYVVFLGNVLRGDFGRSIHFRQPAFRVVVGYLPATFELGLTAFVLASLVALPIGVVSAVRRNSPVDQVTMGLALVGQSAPTFFIGILLILVVSLKLGLLPTSGREDWRNLVLPALTLGAFAMASIARLTRSAVLEVLRADYIRTARAKGLSEALVVAKHTLKNAAVPIVTITGLQFGTLLGGAVVTETVFAWPGIGRLAIQSIYNRDYPVVQCTVFLSAVLFIVINFCIDLVYGLLDPRVRPS